MSQFSGTGRSTAQGRSMTASVLFTGDGKKIGHMKGISRDALPFISEALTRIDTNNPLFRERRLDRFYDTFEVITVEVDFKRIIGFAPVVSTDEDDKVVWARELSQSRRWLRCVKGRQPEPTTTMTVVMVVPKEGDEWNIIAGYVGSATPQFMDDISCRETPRLTRLAKQASFDFWSHHAFCLQTVAVWPNTITEKKPASFARNRLCVY